MTAFVLRSPVTQAALLFLVSALQVTDNQVMPLLLPHLREVAWPESDPLHLLIAYALGAAIGPIALTQICPLLAPRRALGGALLVIGLADLLFAGLPSFPAALLLRAAAGAASGVLSFSQLGVAVHAGNIAVTAMTAGFLLAQVVGVPLGAIAVANLGPEAFFLSLAIAAVLLLVLTGILVAPFAPRPEARARGFVALLSSRPHRDGLLASVFVAAAVAGPINLFPSALQSLEGAHLDLQGVGFVYLRSGVGTILALLLGPIVLRRLGRQGLSLYGAFLLVLPLLLMPPASRDATAATALLAGAVLIETLRRSALQAQLASLASDVDRARYLGLRGLVVQISIALGIEAAQHLQDAGGFFLACAAGAALAVISAFFVPDAPPGEGPAPTPVGGG